jgi:hypothetical protein
MFGFSAFAQSPFSSLGGTAYPVNIAEALTATVALGGSATFQGLYDEDFAMSDADAGATFNYFLNISEDFSAVTDENQVSVYDLGVNDAFAFTDSLGFGFVYNQLITDSISLTDTQDVTSLFAGAVNESITVQDSMTGGFFYGVDTDDNITASETVTAQSQLNPSILEAITLVDAEPATAIYNVARVEIMELIDAPIGRGWFRIVDDQTPNWVEINNDQN